MLRVRCGLANKVLKSQANKAKSSLFVFWIGAIIGSVISLTPFVTYGAPAVI